MYLAAMMLLQTMLPIGQFASAETSGNEIFPEWAQGEITALQQLGVFQGYEDGTFRPQEPVTRAEFVAMLSRVQDML